MLHPLEQLKQIASLPEVGALRMVTSTRPQAHHQEISSMGCGLVLDLLNWKMGMARKGQTGNQAQTT